MLYFCKYRQNIATLDQTLVAAYLKIVLALLKEINYISIFTNSQPFIDDEIFMKLMNFLDSIVIPVYWVYSTKRNFKEFWSNKTVFLKILRPVTPVVPGPNIIKRMPFTVIEPRRPEHLVTSFVNQEFISETRRFPGKFTYGF